jgi:hypothetical protein
MAAHAVFEVGEVEAGEGRRGHRLVRPVLQLHVLSLRIAVDPHREVARQPLGAAFVRVAVDRAAQQGLADCDGKFLIDCMVSGVTAITMLGNRPQ